MLITLRWPSGGNSLVVFGSTANSLAAVSLSSLQHSWRPSICMRHQRIVSASWWPFLLLVLCSTRVYCSLTCEFRHSMESLMIGSRGLPVPTLDRHQIVLRNGDPRHLIEAAVNLKSGIKRRKFLGILEVLCKYLPWCVVNKMNLFCSNWTCGQQTQWHVNSSKTSLISCIRIPKFFHPLVSWILKSVIGVWNVLMCSI